MDKSRKALFRKYYVALAYRKRYVEFDATKTVNVTDFIVSTSDCLFAIELFIKLIKDIENGKVDSITGHSIQSLYSQLSIEDVRAVEDNYGEKIDVSTLPTDGYTASRYYWTYSGTNHGNGAYSLLLLDAFKDRFESICGPIPTESEIIDMMKFDGKGWVKVN